MPEGDTLHRAASALRTALAAKPMVRFDAPRLVGPAPQAGRVVEAVESHGRHLEIEWDNGLVLHTHLRLTGSWHLYRRADPWRKAHSAMRAAIEVDDWVAVCFNASLVETYRRLDKRRHPGMGRVGPDICRPDSDLGLVVDLLLSYPDRSARLGEVLLDQRVMLGIGNVYRCEVLWSNRLSPFAPVGSLTERDAIRLVNAAAARLRVHRDVPSRISAPAVRGELAVYGRNGQPCARCRETIEMRRFGQQRRILYWCPGCQIELDPHVERSVDDTPMDPHPAAQRFLADLPWNRDAG